MTIRKRLESTLVNNGLRPREAAEVMKLAENQGTIGAMDRWWDEDETDYSESLLITLSLRINRTALEWIDSHKPRHWARPMFLPEAASVAESSTP